MTLEGKYPVSCKIMKLHYILQVSHIRYLGCDISYETVRLMDITKMAINADA
jgi:hypothetical protein